jgi:hypothetical protein
VSWLTFWFSWRLALHLGFWESRGVKIESSGWRRVKLKKCLILSSRCFCSCSSSALIDITTQRCGGNISCVCFFCHAFVSKTGKSERPSSKTHENLCTVCDKAGQLLCCDTCVLVFHMHCLVWFLLVFVLVANSQPEGPSFASHSARQLELPKVFAKVFSRSSQSHSIDSRNQSELR